MPLTTLSGEGARRRRRHRRATRALPVALLAVAAGAAGAWIATRGDDGRLVVAERYAEAWQRSDWRAMHRLLAPADRRRVPAGRFARLHEGALATATATRVRTGLPVLREDETFDLPVAVDTRAFGTVRAPVRLETVEEDGRRWIRWREAQVFPGLRAGEALKAEVRMGPRGAILARGGEVLAEGPERTPEVDASLAASIVGRLGEPPDGERAALRRAGVPSGIGVGLTGLERIFEERLRSRPGGRLLAGERVLASRPAEPGRDVRTTLELDVQRAAVTALGARLGGAVAMRPRTGELLAVAGIAFSGLQPPGSTFKVVTLAAALAAGEAKPTTRYPVETGTTLEGRRLENADGEACGGTLIASFARSCNSVFAPLGAQVGARRLVAMAERFGFNEDPGIPGAATSTIPPAGEIGDDLAVGATAIGQGRLQASPLQMALVAATVARDGTRPEPLLDRDAVDRRPRGERVVAARTARIVGRAMREVVRSGTGTAAAIPGVAVAGKTGTAELRSTVPDCSSQPASEPPCAPDGGPTPEDTTAWFVAYAPADDPEVAVSVMLVASGQGGDTAAPAARQVLQAALER